ncbi:MAG: hypothetical protein P4L10_12625 [Acidobacteriaceae bacterium]|nr:hypothetical protein [Acidobacteriaceae bacterium]
MSQKPEEKGVSGGEPDYIKEYTEAIKQCLAQRREISQDLVDLDERFKELQGKTSYLTEEDAVMDKELAQLKDQVNAMKAKFKTYSDSQTDVPPAKK